MENFCAYLWSKKQWSLGAVHGTIANVVPLGTWTKVKGAAERGYDLSAARWGTLRWFSRCQWSPEGTLHLLFHPWQTFQLHLLHKGRSPAAVWRLAYKTGPLLYKLKSRRGHLHNGKSPRRYSLIRCAAVWERPSVQLSIRINDIFGGAVQKYSDWSALR